MTAEPQRVSSVLVAGAGIGGLTAAIALARAGLSVSVLERNPQPERIGAGIQLGPNALHVLDALGLLPKLESYAFEPGSAVISHFKTGKKLLGTPLNPAHLSRYGQKYFHVHRADLIDVLAKTALAEGVELLFDTPVDGFENGETSVTVTSRGAQHRADVLIGADGIHSAVREQLLGKAQAHFTGQTAWRALVPVNALPKGLIPPDANVWVGPGQHVVAYYVRRGKLINLVAVKEQKAWADESWRTQGNVQELRAAFSGWEPRVAQLLEAVESCYFWGLFDRPELRSWYKGRIVLLGDACHPMLPFVAQGAAMAIEDAWVLARSLAHRNRSLEDSLKTYQGARLRRTSSVVKRSNSNARLYHASSPLQVAFRNLKLAVGSKAPFFTHSVLDDIYGMDVTKLYP